MKRELKVPAPYLAKDPTNFIIAANPGTTYAKQREKLIKSAQQEWGVNHIKGWSFVKEAVVL
jgi:hypothetical protein